MIDHALLDASTLAIAVLAIAAVTFYVAGFTHGAMYAAHRARVQRLRLESARKRAELDTTAELVRITYLDTTTRPPAIPRPRNGSPLEPGPGEFYQFGRRS